MLEANGVVSVRGERTLFNGLNLAVEPGQLWQVQGPNGAGKSSFLRILAGLLPAQAGQVHFRGQSIADVSSQYHSELLFIGHKAGIKPELTAIENLEFYAAIQGHPLTAPPYELLEQLGLVGLEDIPAQRLSAGQQRRIALARLWLNSASLWILDEPFTSLDVSGIDLLHQRFQQHLASGGAVILTSHQALNDLPVQVHTLALEYQFE
ncbi:heme ABC transporter ATP-binding protein CcmA [Aliidiomarina taiwanensis]|uniref:Heme ABC transporter ATP-binding protein CcmA n=1 Tax=Aliidiomarina taiwanensis TaxID=946228 RepID=A0A432X8G8_9GAMM|nr:heme ABC transporter ATP-binding protein CcmA [Aliidiomarina taiwanensis]